MYSSNAMDKRPQQRATPYTFQGTFYEACDCYTICPCWTGGEPDDGYCTGVFAWAIETGTIGGVVVAGRQAVSVSRHAGSREGSRQQVMFFFDQAATAEQAEALVGALTGAFGGPLAELGSLLGEFVGAEAADIMLERDGRRTLLTVGQTVQVEGSDCAGAGGKPITLADARLSEVLGSPAYVAVADQFRISVPKQGFSVDLQGRSAMHGRFSYRHAAAG